MNSDQENFEELRKLLALKKHEQPPPGYFNQLPNQIWAKIEAQEAVPSFWTRFVSSFVLKPSVAYGFALVVCATLVAGIGTALRNEPQNATGGNAAPFVHQQLPQAMPPGAPAFAQEFQRSTPTNESSTNPVIHTPPAFQLNVQPARFQQ